MVIVRSQALNLCLAIDHEVLHFNCLRRFAYVAVGSDRPTIMAM